MRLVVTAIVVGLVGVVGVAEAQFVRWTDERGNAHYTEGIDNVPERFRSTAVPLTLRNQSLPAPGGSKDAAGAPANPKGGTVIRYTPGQPIMVDVRINGSGSARLVLDTGADVTLIRPRALAAAGVPLTREIAQVEMRGVTGSERMPFVVVDSLEIGEARANRMPVAAWELPQSSGDGLLGRDFLDRFTVNIDSGQGTVTLTPK